jgi:hypothetical protein
VHYECVAFDLLAYDGKTNFNLSNDCSSGCKVMQQLPLSLKPAEFYGYGRASCFLLRCGVVSGPRRKQP